MNVFLRGVGCGLAMAWALMAPGTIRGEDAAIVNGTSITTQDVDSAFRRTSAAQKKDLTPNEEKLYRKHILKVLVNDRLVSQYLDQRNIAGDEQKVNQHIAEVERQLAAKGKKLSDFLAELGVDEAHMRQDIRNIYRWFAFVESQATDKALREYFEANKEAFAGTLVRASHILVKVDPDTPAKEKQAARKRIEAIRAQLAGGTAFAELAKTHSDCPSKENGGDLDFFPRKHVMTEEFASAAFALPVGRVSQVVETEFGYHLILVTDRKAGKPITFEQVADEVKGDYAEDLRSAVIARMRQTSEIKMLR